MREKIKKISEVKKLEMEYMKNFAKEACFDAEILRDQFRSLWTAYCLHNDLTVDMSVYKNDILELWDVVSFAEPDTAEWSDLGSFDKFMCRYLI